MITLFIAGAVLFVLLSKRSQSPCPGCDSSMDHPITSATDNNPANSNVFWTQAADAGLGGGVGSGGGFSVLGSSASSTAAAASSSSTSSSGSNTTSGGPINYPCFTGPTEVRVSPDGYQTIENLYNLFIANGSASIYNLTGFQEVTATRHEVTREQIVDLGGGEGVTLEHPMNIYGSTPAREFYRTLPRETFTGWVYDLSVKTTDDNARHFVLRNGDVAHNKPIAS